MKRLLIIGAALAVLVVIVVDTELESLVEPVAAVLDVERGA